MESGQRSSRRTMPPADPAEHRRTVSDSLQNFRGKLMGMRFRGTGSSAPREGEDSGDPVISRSITSGFAIDHQASILLLSKQRESPTIQVWRRSRQCQRRRSHPPDQPGGASKQPPSTISRHIFFPASAPALQCPSPRSPKCPAPAWAPLPRGGCYPRLFRTRKAIAMRAPIPTTHGHTNGLCAMGA